MALEVLSFNNAIVLCSLATVAHIQIIKVVKNPIQIYKNGFLIIISNLIYVKSNSYWRFCGL